MTSTKSKEIADEYISSLSDLTINSKPLIDMLTMLAEDNVEHASTIVQAVENHLQKVGSDVKLPVLYLIDSIVKNVSGAYLKLFTENIVNTFCNVFKEVNEKTRASMWKLRQTWDDVFPAKKLFSLDVRVKSIDPAWPITAPSPTISSGSIHLNPRFLSMPQPSPTSIVSPVKMPPGEPVSVSEASMREQLLKKQRELLELQKQKIELELLQAKTSLEQQQKQLDKQTASVKGESIIPTAHVVPSTEPVQGKPVAPVVPSQAAKQVEKQFPAAAASLLKNAGTNNGPRIAPASSLLVASARSMSRDPRVKLTSTSQEQPHINAEMDSRLRQGTLPNDGMTDTTTLSSPPSLSQATSITTVLSDQLKQQLITKQAVTSTMNTPTLNNVSGDVAILNASSNDNNHASHNNNNNKTLSGNTSKDAVSHRTSQKKDPRSSSNNCGNVNNNGSKLISNQSTSGPVGPLFFIAHSSSGGGSSRGGVGSGGAGISGGSGSEVKSKEPKNMSSSSLRGSSSLSGNDKSSASSKSSHRKVGGKSRSKQPQTSSNKITKLERDASPIRSKSRDKDSSDGSSSTSSRTSPQSSSQLSKSRTKSNSKLRKRSPSPPYRIPRRSADAKSNSSSLNNSSTAIGGLTEEEQSGSLIVSPPHPPTFKEIRPNARQRNYIRRNKEFGNISPDQSSQGAINAQAAPESLIKSASKDEDLRPALPVPGAALITTVTEKKEDLDLRILPPTTNKRQSADHVETSSTKKSKAEKFDALFGNEDVDLRTLTNPKAGRPPTPPPPVISGEDNKASWAKLKTPTKSEREKPINSDEKRDRDRNKDRPGRTRLYNNKMSEDPKDRRRPFTNDDDRPTRRSRDLDKPDRHSDRNIEIIMKQAEEQLNQGSISKAEYHTLIQEVWQMNEDQKLRAAQRKEKETGSIIWEKNLDIGSFGADDGEIGHRGKDHSHGRNGPRWQTQPWQQPGPWAHPAAPSFGGHFPSDYRPMGPWQNTRQFGPIRPDYNQFHGFNSGMAPGPRMTPSLLGPMGPNGPIIPSLLPNGPLGPIGLPNSTMAALNGPPSLLMNGPHQPHANLINRALTPTRNISPNSIPKFDAVQDETQSFDDKNTKEPGTQGRELPPPDPKLLDEISSDTMKSINIDNVPREIRYYGQTGVVFMSWDEPREIGFQDGIRRILVDDKDTIVCAFNEPYKEFVHDGEIHRIRLGAPTRELYVDDKWYECYFGGPPIKVDLGNKKISIKLEGPPPQVKIGTVKRTDLVIAKINLIINARNMVPVFLDAKPQMFEIDGQPQTLEFTDALETVLLNGRPFKVEFGGLPKPIVVRDKKHFIRFSVLPRGVRAGSVKIANMKGDTPAERSSNSPTADVVSSDISSSTLTKNTGLEPDSISQDASNDVTTTSKPDFQLDMLSSALSSAMAPSSGLSYQAEPTEKPVAPTPTLPLNLNLNELFQRLVETGIVPKIAKTETKKTEEEPVKKEPEISPITFDKPETLKVKQPAISASLYSGMQCSSCGARFAPELATRYSHHLDWHFRQNRREKDSARKAHSRPWYYDVSEWIQFEEIEDLEDRAQSWFEVEKQMAETEGASSVDSPQETIQPSVPTGNDEDAAHCQVCHDAFEQFYNEEKEEWHLRPAVCFEDKNYHPLCLEDHKRSLEKSAAEFDESLTEQEEEKKEDVDESESKLTDETIEKDALSENNETEIVNTEDNATQLVQEDTDEKIPEVGVTEEMAVDEQEVTHENASSNDNDEHREEHGENEETMKEAGDEESAPKSDADTNAETVPENIEATDETKPDDENVANVLETLQTIKKEPEDGHEMEWQPDCNIEIKTEPIDPEPEPEETVVTDVAALVDTTLTAVKSSIDGNVEHDSAPPMIPTTGSRIKINITKVIVSKEPEEPKEKAPTVETSTEEINAPLVPASIKPTLRGRKLSNMPPVTKDSELSGLCSIM